MISDGIVKQPFMAQEVEKEQPAPAPYRWRYIFAIVISVILGAYFVFRKTKLIAGLASVVRKLF
jgi:hypothetical protein